MNKKWELYDYNDEETNKVTLKYNISKLLATILINRNIINLDENINTFLEPTRNDFHDPYKMPDMKKAVDRIIKAINNKEKVIIYGDYDVDGITSTMVLKSFLDENGLKVGYRIPNRLHEGYGLNKKAIEEIAEQGYSLIITVDCGISGTQEVKYAYDLGMEVIITDHHEPLDTIPDAVAVIDCKRNESKYPFKSLAGCGVVFKLIQALSQVLKLEEKAYLKYLDIVCIGTISDIVPLVDENRVIAKLGLKLANQTRNYGLACLLRICGFNEVSSNSISFGIAPRINACGRMGHEEEALKLFLSKNIEEAKNITIKLNEFNRERQDIEKRIFDEAIKQIEENELDKKSVIIIGHENWHHGVIGIVASKITDLYYKPSILVCFENGIAKGSGRSIQGFDLHNALCECSDLLEKYGGHEMAVGVNLKLENFESFKTKMESIANRCHTEDLVSIIKIEKEVSLNDITTGDVESLKLLEPFGEENRVPLFLFKNLKIDSIRTLSEGKHLKLTLKQDRNIVQAIGFNLGYLVDEYRLGDKIDLVGCLEINEFNGNKTVQINIKDLRKTII